jgi:hypothetical protein
VTDPSTKPIATPKKSAAAHLRSWLRDMIISLLLSALVIIFL